MGNCGSSHEKEEEEEGEGSFFDAAHSSLIELPHEMFDVPRLEEIDLQANMLKDLPKVRVLVPVGSMYLFLS